MTDKVLVKVVVPEAEPFEKVIPRTLEAISDELTTIGEGLLYGMPDLPIVIEIHPASPADDLAHRLAAAGAGS